MSSQAYPLHWPTGWPRTEKLRREDSRFSQTLPGALKKLRGEVGLMNGKNLILSSNCTLGDDRPADSGVVAYFQLENVAMAMPCDRWKKVEDNVYAIALTVNAMRGMERWGAKHMITAMFSGFKSLPEKAGVDYRSIMGLSADAVLTEESITAAYRRKAMTTHPDKGGSNESWAQLREAHDILMQNVRK